MTFSKRLALFTALVAPAFVTPALAQDIALDEMIVTAQKRAENIQDVPFSVDTIDGERFSQYQSAGEDILSIAARVPGVYAESSNGRLAPRFYIRGLGNVDFDLAASQPVSIIIDDVVQENVLLKSNPIFDSERVEVLRGPQGTLFGRNTPAGIIKFDSRRPTQEFSGNANLSYGSFNTVVGEFGIGGPIVQDQVAARVSGLYRQRDDYIDNLLTTPGDDDVGRFEEFAGRIQLLFTPNDRLDILLNAHGRTLDGSSSPFRANALEQGESGLEPDFQRDEIFLDDGDGNPQEGDTYGFSGRLDYELDFATFTSITAYEGGKSFSFGDVDGGFVGPNSFFDPANPPFPLGPDAIAFPAATQDSLSDLDQFTQEFRLTSNLDGPLQWQAGFYYFDTSFDVTTVGPDFPPETTVSHSNDTWAIFGQASYELTDKLTVTGGIRYTDDERTFEAPVPPPTVTVNRTEVEDDDISWDISALYEATPEVNLYARIARGFRGPTIQGRDVAFAAFSGATDPQTVAESETIHSFEVGFKSQFLENRVRLNAAAFYYEIDDQQFSIIGGAGNLNQVINADQGTGIGFETDLEFLVSENFFLQAGFSYNDTEIEDETLATAICGSGLCTPTDPLNEFGQALIDGNPFPNAPEITFNAFAEYTYPWQQKGEFFINSDIAVAGEINFLLYEAEEFRTSGDFEIGAQIGYRTDDGRYSIALFGRNITDEENIRGVVDFNNLTAFVNDPQVFGVALGANF